uniref:Uncharacterized protein n=1 Tax=Loxodonta africana TaxID=9785 RepID=G3TPI0_LOXAF
MVELHSSFTELFTFFCTNTTIHGPHCLLGSSRSCLRRATWGLLLQGTLGIFCWKFVLHLQECLGYQAARTVPVHGGSRLSPSITLCDMNPHWLVRQHLEELDEFARENIYSLYKFNLSEGRWPTSTAPMANSPGPETTFQLDRKLRLQRLIETGSQYKVGFRLCNSTGSDCFNRTYSSGEKAVREWYHFHYMNILATAQEDSHQNHFVLSCEDNQRDCLARGASRPIYGSCYTFNDILTSTHQDISQGITLLLRVEQQDHLPLLSTEAGIKIMVRGRKYTPFLEPPFLEPRFLEARSFSILPGTETTISITEEAVHRLRSPYGACVDRENGAEVPLLYNTSYTTQVGPHRGRGALMVKNCSCDYYRYPLPAGAEYCTYARHPAWGHCFYSLYQELETHSLSWFSLCLKPCNESFYKLSMGTSRWPSSKSADWILTVLGGPQNRSQSPRSNIAKVNIYQRHSYLKMKETPPVKKLFSDMKDLMSLLFGMSVLSLVELLELLLDAVALALLLGYHR